MDDSRDIIARVKCLSLARSLRVLTRWVRRIVRGLGGRGRDRHRGVACVRRWGVSSRSRAVASGRGRGLDRGVRVGRGAAGGNVARGGAAVDDGAAHMDNGVGLLGVSELEIKLSGYLADEAGLAEEGEECVAAGTPGDAVLGTDLAALEPCHAAGTGGENAVECPAETAAPVGKLLLVHPVLNTGYPVGNAAGRTVVCAVANTGMPEISHLLMLIWR